MAELSLVECLEEFVLYSGHVDGEPLGVFHVKPRFVCYFPSEFWDKCQLFIGRNEKTGGLLGPFRTSALDYLVKDFFDALEGKVNERRWQTILQCEVCSCTDSHFFERMFVINGLVEVRRGKDTGFSEEDIDLGVLQGIVVDDFLWNRGIKNKLVIREIRKNIISDERFQDVFTTVFEEVFMDYGCIFKCSPCQRNEVCTTHSFVFRKFKRLPHLVHRMILKKVHKSDVLILRMSSEDGLCIADEVLVKRRVCVTLNSHRKFEFTLNPFVSWRLGFESKHIKVPLSDAVVPLHLVDVELEDVKELSDEILQFMNNNKIQSLTYSLHCLPTKSLRWGYEMEKILLYINLNLHRMNNLRLVKFEKGSRRVPKDTWNIHGFSKEITKYNIVFRRIE